MSFSADWLTKFADPYAVLGISVSADDRRIMKRYRDVAKLLHPDRYSNSDSEQHDLANQMLARLVNPAYQRLKQDKGRAEALATLRFRVRRLSRDQAIEPHHPTAIKLVNLSVEEAEIFYEQTITTLATQQYQDLGQFETSTQALCELNLIYLHIKMGEPIIRQKRSGLMVPPKGQPIVANPQSTAENPAAASTNYAQRHYERAVEYVKKENWPLAVQELRDAIRIEPKRSQYHALLGNVYLRQNFPGMATVHIRQALKLNPADPVALRCAAKLNLKIETSTAEQKVKARGGLLGNLFARRN